LKTLIAVLDPAGLCFALDSGVPGIVLHQRGCSEIATTAIIRHTPP